MRCHVIVGANCRHFPNMDTKRLSCAAQTIKMLSWISILALSALVITVGGQQDSQYLSKGKCKGLWRPDHLVGRCFGLKKHNEYPELKDITTVKSVADCKAICCNMGDACVSWQYEKVTKDCKLGDKVRLGHEVTGTPNWCDPLPPGKWNGKKLESRSGGKCNWRPEQLTTQCFGLGSERMSQNKERLNTESCEQACCNDPTCLTWQEMPGRGCYYSDSKSVYEGTCDENGNAVYDGMRKCLPGYCDGKEHILLSNSSSFAKPSFV